MAIASLKPREYKASEKCYFKIDNSTNCETVELLGDMILAVQWVYLVSEQELSQQLSRQLQSPIVSLIWK